MIVRQARDDELDAVSALILAAFEEHLRPLDLAPETRAAVAEYRADLADVRSRLPIALLLVADDQGELVGSVTLQRPGSPPWPPGWASIRLLSVDPARRGRGLGRLLTTTCIDLAREQGATAIGLHTTSQLAVARALYRRMAFTRVPEHDEWPAPGIHAEAWVLPFRSVPETIHFD